MLFPHLPHRSRALRRLLFGASAVGTGGGAALWALSGRGGRLGAAPGSKDPWGGDAVADAFASAWGAPPAPHAPPAPPQPPSRPQPTVYRGRTRGGRPTAGALLAANVAVWLGWMAPPGSNIHRVMHEWFLTSAASLRRGWKGWAQMLLSTYSHSGLMHLGFNMLALWSFAPRLMDGRSTPETVSLGKRRVRRRGVEERWVWVCSP